MSNTRKILKSFSIGYFVVLGLLLACMQIFGWWQSDGPGGIGQLVFILLILSPLPFIILLVTQLISAGTQTIENGGRNQTLPNVSTPVLEKKNTVESITHALLVLIGRFAIAVPLFMLAYAGVYLQGLSGSHNSSGDYATIYIFVLFISFGIAAIFKSGWMSRVVSFVVVYACLISYIGFPTFLDCMSRTNDNLKYETSQQLKEQGMTYSTNDCVRRFILP